MTTQKITPEQISKSWDCFDLLNVEEGWRFAEMKKGRIVRDKEGQKKTPGFKSGWLAKAVSSKYKATRLDRDRPYLICTGKESNIIAVDCDNTATAQIVSALAGDNPWVIRPVGKAGITYIFEYEPAMSQSRPIKKDMMELDFLSDGRGLFAPTPTNETKEVWTSTPASEPPPMPEMLKTFLTTLFSDDAEEEKEEAANANALVLSPKSMESMGIPEGTDLRNLEYYPALAPLVEPCIRDESLPSSLLRVLTPKKLRKDYSKVYANKGYLSPSDIKKGSGSNYLLAVSTILGNDESINSDLYSKTIELFNSNLQSPLDPNRLNSTIVFPMLNKKAKHKGKVIWKYNKFWDKQSFVILDKNDHIITVVIDAKDNTPYVIDMTKEQLFHHQRASEVAAMIRLITGKDIKPVIIEQRAKSMDFVHNYTQDFGFFEDPEDKKLKFNTFRASEALEILKAPANYSEKFKDTKPTTTLEFLEHVIPHEKDRTHFISFLKTKLTTFRHSPLIFNFTGAPGSGKDTLFEYLQMMVDTIHTFKPTVDQMLSPYNAWMQQKLFILCNEFPDSLPAYQYNSMRGRMKEISGSPTFACREMRMTAFDSTHNITIITAQNSSMPLADANDRRHIFISTPTPLVEWDKLVKYESSFGSGDALGNFRDKLFSEIDIFAYYLATEVEALKDIEYAKANQDDSGRGHKLDAINDPVTRYAAMMKEQQWEYLTDTMQSMEELELSDKEEHMINIGAMPATLAKNIIAYWGAMASTYQLNTALKTRGLQTCTQISLPETKKRVRGHRVPGLKEGFNLRDVYMIRAEPLPILEAETIDDTDIPDFIGEDVEPIRDDDNDILDMLI